MDICRKLVLIMNVCLKNIDNKASKIFMNDFKPALLQFRPIQFSLISNMIFSRLI